MAKNVSLWGADYTAVPALDVPQTGGGTARFIDPSPTTAIDSDVANGKIYFKADGTQSTGTGSGGTPTLETVTKTYTPSTSAVTDTITPSSGYDGIEEVDVTVSAVPLLGNYTLGNGYRFITENGQRKFRVDANLANMSDPSDGYIHLDRYETISGNPTIFDAIATGTTVTPTESSQTIGGYRCMMESAVTVNAIPSNYVGSGITQRDSTDLSASGATVTAPSGYYASNASYSIPYANFGVPSNERTKENGKFIYTRSFPQFTSGYLASASPVVLEETLEDKTVTPSTSQQVITPTGSNYYLNSVTVDAMPSGTEGTPTINVGNLYRGERLVTASVTNTEGYISGGTHDADGIILSAGDFVTGSYTITENDTYNVASVAEVVVQVEPSLQSKTNISPTTSSQTIEADSGYDGLSSVQINAMPSGTEGTPTATKGAVSNHSIAVTPSVTNSAGYISGGTHNGTAVSVSASELVSGTYTVSSSGTADVTNYASVSVPQADVAGAVDNYFTTQNGQRKWHNEGYLQVNAEGWIDLAVSVINTNYNAIASGTSVTPTKSSQTIGGANYMMEGAVTVNAIPSQYIIPSGNLPITQNGNNIDVTNYATVSVNVSGGGGTSTSVSEASVAVTSATSSISFNSLLGEPTSFVVLAGDDVATGASPYKVAMVVYDGTSDIGQTITNTNNAQVSYDGSGFSHTYSNGTLTVTATTTQFQANTTYFLAYSYGGSAANIHTADVQVGSGATSITFTGLEDKPLYWSCIFKSNFATSSGYQRVVGVYVDSQDDEYGLCMDSAAHFSASYWTSSYSNGSLTITSQGTNAGGYFHQPGYYQLTYVLADASPYQKINKTYSATTTTQTEKIEASSGYDAIGEVNVTVNPISQTNLTAANIKNGTTVTINNGSTNIYSVTGTYSGGGGGSATVATTTWTNTDSTATSHTFSSLSGTPIAAFLRCTTSLSRSSSSTNYFIADMVWTGSACRGNSFRRSNGTYANVTSGYSATTGTNSITFSSSGTSTSNPGSFYNGTYELTYIY